jgi:hypothetical protein
LGLDVRIQNQLQFRAIMSGTQFHQTWSRVKNNNGIKDLVVSTYGSQFCLDFEKLWNGGLGLWTSWISDQRPRTFDDAAASIANAQMPLYASGRVSLLMKMVERTIEKLAP